MGSSISTHTFPFGTIRPLPLRQKSADDTTIRAMGSCWLEHHFPGDFCCVIYCSEAVTVASRGEQIILVVDIEGNMASVTGSMGHSDDV